jgi:hypothetical protein
MMKWEANHGFPFSRFQKALVFVGGGAADVAHSRQFADVQLPVFVGGIVAEKGSGDNI